MANRSFLPTRNYTGIKPTQEKCVEILEFEVRGETIKKVKIDALETEQWIEWFYEKYGTQGMAYIIRASKMNFNHSTENNE